MPSRSAYPALAIKKNESEKDIMCQGPNPIHFQSRKESRLDRIKVISHTHTHIQDAVKKEKKSQKSREKKSPFKSLLIKAFKELSSASVV